MEYIKYLAPISGVLALLFAFVKRRASQKLMQETIE